MRRLLLDALERADWQVSDRVTFASLTSLKQRGIHATLETCASSRRLRVEVFGWLPEKVEALK